MVAATLLLEVIILNEYMEQKVENGDHNLLIAGNADIKQLNIGSAQLLPIHFDPDELFDLVSNFKEHIEAIDEDSLGKDFVFIPLEEKNKINKVSIEYYECIKESSPYFPDIDVFLKDNKNKKLRVAYYECCFIIKRKIAASYAQHPNFASILEHIKDTFVLTLPVDLKRKHRLAPIIVDFMYCNCDIGKKEW